MAINLDKHRDALISAWKDVLDDKSDTNWALFGYEGLSNDLKFVCKGDGGLAELIDDLNGGKIMYAFLKVDVPSGSVSKYVLINWQGEGAPIVRKGTCANHIKQVVQFFTGFHLTMHARTEDDLDEKVILDKLAKAGSAFDFKSIREEVRPAGPVGTTYKKVNPVQEINSSERDQFWMKEEAEEKRRVEAEKKRKEEEKRKADEEIRKRAELDAAKGEAVDEQRESASISGDSGPGVAERRVGSGAWEARHTIGASVAQARAALLQPPPRTNSIPEKPVRSSVIAQRINTFTQQAQNNTPTSPAKMAKSPSTTNKTSPFGVTLKPTNHEAPAIHNEPIKTSPIKNIDKIKMSLETPSQIQYDPIIDPSDLSPSTEETQSFSAINYSESENNYSASHKNYSESDKIFSKSDQNHSESEKSYSESDKIYSESDKNYSENDKNYSENDKNYREIDKEIEPMIKQNIVDENLDASYSSGNEDDDSDNKFSTIKRSPYSKNNITGSNDKELKRQNTVIENVNYKKEQNGNATHEDVSPEGMEEDGAIYEDLDDDPGLTARALYDYQAADESEITFDPGDIITHIDQIDSGWWQGLGPHGTFGLFPANYVELLPAEPH